MNNHYFLDGHKDNNNLKAIAFITYVKGKLIKKRIGEKVDESLFNQASQVILKKHPESDRINKKLKLIEDEYYKLLKINPEPTSDDIGELIKSIKENKKIQYIKVESDSLVYWVYKYRDEKCKSESAIEAYEYTGKSIEDYEAYNKYKVTVDYIEHNADNFRNNFVDFLKTELTINGKVKKINRAGTVVNKIEKINAVINWYNTVNKTNINRLKVNLNKDNKADDREISHLDINELNILYTYYINDKLTEKPTYLNALGKFLLRSFTGLRISELANLHSKSFEGDKLTFYSTKTKKKVEIPLFEQAKVIASKLNYEFYSFKDKKDKTAKTSFESTVVRYYINKFINDRDITEYNYDTNQLSVFKLSEKISSHSARKTFGTLIYNHTNNIYIASKFLHHSSIEDTVRYLGLNIDNLLDYVVDLKIGGESVIKNIETDNSIKDFTLYNLDDTDIVLSYSNLIIELTGMYNEFNTKGKEEIKVLELDNKYKIEGSIYNLDSNRFLFKNEVTLSDDKKVVRMIKKGIYRIKQKGVN
ncbi:tyrosine-type recombinase/integrase [Belliella sp. DSM 107340]|uniref:Tyrosine-type recombinase/integrase n=1 Tax=Belliella calami TaxID=2923436 RepID=A0ABS9UK86_9BACT|nr:tyrosine-type recombinase/integrase [Belliella calami]MCH7396580.1 tyrosine-type recombinase/integrase [Belliella calami]